MNKVGEVWIVDDDRSIRWVLEKALEKAGIHTQSFSSAGPLLQELKSTLPDAIVTDIRMPGLDGLGLLQRIQEEFPGLPVIVMTAHSDLESAVSAFHGGAFEYLPKPFDIDEAVDRVQRAIEQARNLRLDREPIPVSEATPEIIGGAPSMQEVFRAIARLARSHITVLINGESGTGKELVAKALHRHSPRSAQPFIALNMAAIPRDLLESELFGHERGAFTGAQARRAGRFEQADGGTLFLDEIGDMPAELQTRLLRVLADGEFFPIGAHAPVRVDVRIIAATHQNLDALVDEGRFREDLYHRLNVIRIHLPPLRERRADIPLLLRHFLKEASEEIRAETKTLRPEVEEFLSGLDWPGNVRQLENTCRWITVMAAGKDVHLADLPPELQQTGKQASELHLVHGWQESLADWIREELKLGHMDIAKVAIDEAEGILIRTALESTRGRRQEAARLLGYGRNTLTRKITELNLDV